MQTRQRGGGEQNHNYSISRLWYAGDMKELEDNPQTQITFHKRMMRVWLANAPFVILAYICTYIFPLYAVQILAGIATYTALISLYANWVSDFDGLSAAQSTLETIKQNRIPEKSLHDLLRK